MACRCDSSHSTSVSTAQGADLLVSRWRWTGACRHRSPYSTGNGPRRTLQLSGGDAPKACLSAYRMLLHVTHQPPLRSRVAVDVAFGRFDGTVSSEQLHVAQATSRAINVAGGDGDETAPTGLRRAAFEAEFNAIGLQVAAAIRANRRTEGLGGAPASRAPAADRDAWESGGLGAFWRCRRDDQKSRPV
jgi:hypothetical protein